MSIFDQLKTNPANPPRPAAESFAGRPGNQKQTVTFDALPENLAQMQCLPEAALDDPYKTAALTVCALCAYAADKQIGAEMLNWLRGPRPLSPFDISFLNDRFRDGKYYVPFSYFKGAVPESDYTPDRPYVLEIEANPYSDANPGYKKLFLRSGGADNPREIVLRMRGDGKWFLWDQFLLMGIREPKSRDPWA